MTKVAEIVLGILFVVGVEPSHLISTKRDCAVHGAWPAGGETELRNNGRF